MRLIALLFLAVVAGFAQDCFKAPVMTGTVTISCTAIDNTANPSLMSADPGLFVNYPPSYLLAVRVTSSDPAVIGARITVTYPDGGFSDGRLAKSIGVATKQPTS